MSGLKVEVYNNNVELALKNYPNAEVLEHIAEAGNTFDHLPDTPDYY